MAVIKQKKELIYSMITQEILRLIGNNKNNTLIFFKEGSFRKCYNQHVMYFTENIKMMKIHTRFYKNVNTYMHSLGFPETALERYILLLQDEFQAVIEKETPEYIQLSKINWHKKQNYEAWRIPHIRKVEELQVLQNKAKQLLNGNNSLITQNKNDKLVNMIQSFRLEEASPLDTFNFMQKLKKIVNEG